MDCPQMVLQQGRRMLHHAACKRLLVVGNCRCGCLEADFHMQYLKRLGCVCCWHGMAIKVGTLPCPGYWVEWICTLSISTVLLHQRNTTIYTPSAFYHGTQVGIHWVLCVFSDHALGSLTILLILCWTDCGIHVEIHGPQWLLDSLTTSLFTVMGADWNLAESHRTTLVMAPDTFIKSLKPLRSSLWDELSMHMQPFHCPALLEMVCGGMEKTRNLCSELTFNDACFVEQLPPQLPAGYPLRSCLCESQSSKNWLSSSSSLRNAIICQDCSCPLGCLRLLKGIGWKWRTIFSRDPSCTTYFSKRQNSKLLWET